MLQPDRIVSTTCPYCGVGCTLQLHLTGDTIYKVTSPFDSPVNHGNLCVKGRFATPRSRPSFLGPAGSRPGCGAAPCICP